MTQEQPARRFRTTNSAIFRIENHTEDIMLSTIGKVAKALGKKLVVGISYTLEKPVSRAGSFGDIRRTRTGES